MKVFIRVTMTEGRAMIIDINNIEVIEEGDNCTLFHFTNGRTIWFRDSIDSVQEQIEEAMQVQNHG